MRGPRGGSGFGGLTLRDVCDVAYLALLERVERRALADRQALLTAAAIRDDTDYQPLSLDAAVDAFDAWLISDPAQSPEAIEAEMSRRYLEEVA